ncbi:MAG: hypothetical protein IKN93_01815 [Bacteroidales bacterium]|nr:hypothetical protein [Bacteroidales bacterium]
MLLLVLLSCQKEEPKNNHPNLGPGQLKVMTFNIRGTTTEDDAFNNWGMRAGACRDMIIDQQPSIVGFQELVATEWKYMSGTLASHGYVGAPVDDPMNSFMYRPDELEVLSEGVFWLSDTPDKSSTSWDGYVRYVHWAVMKVLSSGQEFFYINTHFGLTTASRKSAMTLIQKRIKLLNTNNLPIVMMADFNTHATDSVFEGIRESMVCTREVAPITDDVKTYNAWGNEAKAYQCDHIWITNTIKCSEYKTVTQWYDGHKYVSDHFPVYSIIEF